MSESNLNLILKERTDKMCSVTFDKIIEVIESDAHYDIKITFARQITNNLKKIFDNMNAGITLLEKENKKLLIENNYTVIYTNSKNFTEYFNSIKDKVVEFGFYGIENLSYSYKLNNLSLQSLNHINNSENCGVKYKYCFEISEDEFFLKDLENIDILENINLFDAEKKNYDFEIEICKENTKNENIITKDKIIPINILYNYKITFLKPLYIDKFYLEATAYTFLDYVKRKLVNFS